jgi:protein FRA10AC1
LARAYESKLFKEYALVCYIYECCPPKTTYLLHATRHQIDLKHYKTRQIALRWRTAEEVIDSIGETTCASLRCPYHNPSQAQLAQMEERGIAMPPLQAFELPFAYVEAGEKKQALVKVKVCEKCARKITYKPSDEAESSRDRETSERHRSGSGRLKSDIVEDDRRKSSRRSSRSGARHQSRRSESPRQ